MTAEFTDIENAKTEPRDINTLYDLPYSEMTEDEIELVINYKAEQIANNLVHTHNMQTIQDGMREQIEYNRKVANKSITRLDELTAHAIQRYGDASNG